MEGIPIGGLLWHGLDWAWDCVCGRCVMRGYYSSRLVVRCPNNHAEGCQVARLVDQVAEAEAAALAARVAHHRRPKIG